MILKNLTLIILLAPLLGSLIAGILGKKIGPKGAHSVTIGLMILSFFAAILVCEIVFLQHQNFEGSIYTWAQSGSFRFDMGFLIDPLTAIMMLMVTFVSLIVHIYSIGYMANDPGYQRFFSFVSFFTFAMLLLVSANNFMQLFFGWEGVGLASYLLIGFWFKKESAANGSLKAFLVNRAGDFGFILGLAAILDNIGSLNYATVFNKIGALSNATITILPNTHWSLITVIGVLLFIGAMAKSAQVPLHIWLPESMEGPTPISALIHAATMVTAGVFMVARMSPIYELSSTALSFVLIMGSIGGLFLALLAIVENDIKRVIAYSTMSQLGYMMAANGVSAYSASIFHLLTHACFKALLFLAAGSVIIAMHHEQDLRQMGNLKKYLPVTYVCFLIGALSLCAIPPFAGFYSKDTILEAVKLSQTPGAHFAYACLLIATFVTAYYIFRAFFLAFHTKERMPQAIQEHLTEHKIMTIPLILLAIPSVLLGILLMKPMILNHPGILSSSFFVLPQHDVLKLIAAETQTTLAYTFSAFTHAPIWVALCGIFLAWINYIVVPNIPAIIKKRFSYIYFILAQKYGFDYFNDLVFVRGSRRLSNFLFRVADEKLLDDYVVNGTGRGISWFSILMRRLQTGYLYHYVLVMLLGILIFLVWMFIR